MCDRRYAIECIVRVIGVRAVVQGARREVARAPVLIIRVGGPGTTHGLELVAPVVGVIEIVAAVWVLGAPPVPVGIVSISHRLGTPARDQDLFGLLIKQIIVVILPGNIGVRIIDAGQARSSVVAKVNPGCGPITPLKPFHAIQRIIMEALYLAIAVGELVESTGSIVGVSLEPSRVT